MPADFTDKNFATRQISDREPLNDMLWAVIDLNSDNADTIAIVDPDQIQIELDICPADYAQLFAGAPQLMVAAEAVLANLDKHSIQRNHITQLRNAIHAIRHHTK